MNQDRELQIQALLDGELSGRKARQVEQWLATDSQAQALAQELKMTRSLLAANEPELKLPETREFYWNKIQRQIEAVSLHQPPQSRFWLAWRRYLAPVSAV